MSLHRFLSRLIWLCVLPLVLLAVYLATSNVYREQGERNLEAEHIAKNFAAAIDHDLSARVSALNMLATSPLADQVSRRQEFYQEAQGFRQSFGSHVIVADQQRHTLFNTRQPFGSTSTTLPQHKGRSAMLMALKTAKPEVGDVFLGPVANEPIVGVAVPGRRDGKTVFVVGTTIEIRQFQRRLEEVALPSGWSLALLDGTGEAIARNGPPGVNASPGDAFAKRFVVKSSVAPWSVVLDIPRDIYFAPLLKSAVALVLAILGATLAAVFGGRMASRQLGTAVASLAATSARGEQASNITEIAAVGRLLDESLDKRDTAEAARRASEERFRAIFEHAAAGIALLAPDGRWLLVNQKLCDIVGYPRDELLAKNFQDITHPDDLPADLCNLRQMLAGEIDAFSIEKRYLRNDGAIVWINLSVALVRRPDGNPDYFIALIEDIQRRKEAEEALQLAADELSQHRSHLEQLVASRTAELAQARDAAESANHAKSLFLATMSHELRTPLNAVVGLTGLLADSPLGRRQRDYADKIQLAAQALRTLIDDILDFSKIEAGALRLEQAPISLKAILRTLATVVGVGLGHKPIEALFEVAPDVPDALIGDALRLQQILLNLTSNAVKFTAAGVIVVSVRCLARDAGQVTLQFAVRDTGIGIPAEQLVPIFDGFVQADMSTSRLHGGSGLGLTISARLATLMGGHISVDSTVGSGSEFRLDVTLALGVGEPQAAAPDLSRVLNILIIDDHPLARDILTRTCAGFGWQATAVDSGAAGLEALRRGGAASRDYDLVLLDWRMPGMDGLAMLRQAYATADIDLPRVVLMASIFEMKQAVAASDDLHLDGIAPKPLTPASLYDAVTKAYAGEFAAFLASSGKTDRRLAGMRLLVAEDNALNQEVIEQILTRAGAEVVVAANGLAAVAALRVPGARFDAVLMDIQMPVMDGYAATRIIREELGRVDLPIIAVTAFARPEDREKSRRAGMVGHLVKPLDVEDLLALVAQERQRAAPQALASTIDLAGLDVGAALQAFGGDQKKYGNLLRKFVLHHGGDADEARRLFNTENPKGATGLLHGLSGMASLLQATELARLAAAAEVALRDGKAELMPLLFDELQAAMRTLGASVDQLEAMWPGV